MARFGPILSPGGGSGGGAVSSVSAADGSVTVTPTTGAVTVSALPAIAAAAAAAAAAYQVGPLTGDVTTPTRTNAATTLVGTSNVETIIRTNAPNQLAPHTANENFNGFNAINPGAGIVADQFPTLLQLQANQYAYIVSGCLWTPDNAGSSLNGSMTAGTVMIKGILLTVAAITAHAFTASRDTYVDFTDNGDGTAAVTFSAVALNAGSPALAGTNQYDTIRNGIITTAASIAAQANINQGDPAASAPASSAATTTVAAGSNGNNITTSTLSVAANSLPAAGQAQVDTSNGTGGNLGTIIVYTGGGGTTTLTGVTVLAGSGTVSTGGVVTSWNRNQVVDSSGNIIFPTSAQPNLIAYKQKSNAITTTSTSSLPLTPFTTQFIVPPGPPRRVKIWANLALFVSSAAVATSLVAAVNVATPGGSFAAVGSLVSKVAIASDGQGLYVTGVVLLTPGTYVATVFVLQPAAGTLTIGASGLPSSLGVELT